MTDTTAALEALDRIDDMMVRDLPPDAEVGEVFWSEFRILRAALELEGTARNQPESEMSDAEKIELLRRTLVQNNRVLQAVFDVLPTPMYDAKLCLQTRAEANNAVLGKTEDQPAERQR